MNFVLDSSLALAFVFKDEATVQTDVVLDSLGHGAKAFVPSLWRWEIANAFLMAERRKRINQADMGRLLTHLNILPIEIDDSACHQVWTSTLQLAQKYKLSSYDTSYLEMAIRLALSLGSLDDGLRAAARVEKVRLLPS
jgi:predicted nucleic acid-binding protein